MKTLQELKSECLILPRQIDVWEELYKKIIQILNISEDFGLDFKYTSSSLSKDTPFEVIYIQNLINTWIIQKYKLSEKEYCLEPISIQRNSISEPLSYHGSLSNIYVYRWNLKIKTIPEVLNEKNGFWVWNNYKFLNKTIENHKIAIKELIKLNDLFPILS